MSPAEDVHESKAWFTDWLERAGIAEDDPKWGTRVSEITGYSKSHLDNIKAGRKLASVKFRRDMERALEKLKAAVKVAPEVSDKPKPLPEEKVPPGPKPTVTQEPPEEVARRVITALEMVEQIRKELATGSEFFVMGPDRVMRPYDFKIEPSKP